MNRGSDDHGNDKAESYQQRHAYSALQPPHPQQQQEQQLQSHQQGYVPHPSLVNQQLAHQRQQIHQPPLLPPHIQPLYHHALAGSSQSPPTWSHSSHGHAHPRSHYSAESDSIFKGATEHLFSAVQQQLDSMRDHESGEVESQKRASEKLALEQSSSATSQNVAGGSADDSQSADGMLTHVHVRITEANKGVHGEKDQEQNGNTQSNDKQDDSRSQSAYKIKNRKSNNVPARERRPDEPSHHPAIQSITGDSQNMDSISKSSDNAKGLESSQVSSSPSQVPPLYNTPKCNKESDEGQSQKNSDSQPDTQKENEKGVIWQSLMIGGKKVRYKVLGNVKVHKATPQTIKPGTATSKTGTTPIVPGTAIHKTAPVANLNPKKAKRGKAKNLKIVKLMPGTSANKRGRPPVHVRNSSDDGSSQIQSPPSKSGRPRKLDNQPGMSQDFEEATDLSTRKDKSPDADKTLARQRNKAGGQASQNGNEEDNVHEQTADKELGEAGGDDNSDPSYQASLDSDGQKRKMEDIPERRLSLRKRKPLRKMRRYLEEDVSSDPEPIEEYSNQSKHGDSKHSKRHVKGHSKTSSRLTRWPYQEIRALAGFLVSAKKAGLYKKEWPTMKDNESFWDRAADCTNAVRLDKKKRTGAACAHWTHCYMKPKFVTTSQMSFHFNSIESKSAEFHASPDQYETCKCYKPSKKTVHKVKRKTTKHFASRLHRDRGIQATTLSVSKETQTSVSTVSVGNGLKDFVSMLTAQDALEVADQALHYALKEKKLYNVAGNFLELCVGAFAMLQKYRQPNMIEEFARVLSTCRDDGLPRMQPDKMPFAMIAYNIRYFNNTSPFGLTVPLPYAEWLHSMYNIFGQRFHELFEGPTPDKMEIADRHPYRNQLLNVATVSKAYLKRQTDEKDKAAEENPSEEAQEASRDVVRKKSLMNKQGRALRELMTDVAIPSLARRKLQQAFAIIQRASNLTTPDNEPTCEHCGAAIPRPPKPPRKYNKKKRDRKRLKGDAGSKHDAKKRRIETSKHKSGRQGKGNASQQGHVQSSLSRMKPNEPQQNYPYRASGSAGPLDRMLINAPGMTPARELPPSLQDKWIPPSHEGWAPVRPQQVPATVAAVAAAAREVYANQATVDIMWQPGQPSTGWQHGDARTSAQQQQQQHPHHPQRTQMEPSTSSSSVVHIGQTQGSHSYY